MLPACRQRHEPRREHQAADLDDVGPLALDDAAERAAREEKAILRLSRNAGAAHAIRAHTAVVDDVVAGAGMNEHLSQVRAATDVLAFGEQIGPDATARFSEPFGDVENRQRHADMLTLARDSHVSCTSHLRNGAGGAPCVSLGTFRARAGATKRRRPICDTTVATG
jgi:hypothetical protein